jgi:membrane fusion protein (multidrug efflux system)
MGLLLALALLGGCGKDGQPAGAPAAGAPPAMPVTVVQAQPQSVPTVIEAVGQVEGSKDVEVRARVAGILTKQLYKEGDKVKEGTVLFTIDREPYEIALMQARAQLAQNKADLEQARREVKRLQPLVEQRAVSQKDLDDATTTLQSTKAKVLASEAQVRDAELNLSYTKVTAPITGVTDRAQYSEGTLVTPGAATSLLTTMHIIDPIWVRFAFSEADTLRMRKAKGETEVKLILPDGSPYRLPGKLNFVSSTVDQNTGTVPMRATFPNPDSLLLPGQYVRVEVTIGHRQAFLIPQAAVTENDQGKSVFVVGPDNTATPRPVVADEWSGHDWVVTEGLKPDDKVIVDNLMKLRPGAPVAPHPPGGPGSASGGAPAPGKH